MVTGKTDGDLCRVKAWLLAAGRASYPHHGSGTCRGPSDIAWRSAFRTVVRLTREKPVVAEDGKRPKGLRTHMVPPKSEELMGNMDKARRYNSSRAGFRTSVRGVVAEAWADCLGGERP